MDEEANQSKQPSFQSPQESDVVWKGDKSVSTPTDAASSSVVSEEFDGNKAQQEGALG